MAMKPPRQFGGALDGSIISAGVCPFAQARLDEALGLSIGLRRIGLCEDVLQAEALACLAEGFGTVAGAVVGHDALDLHTQACVIGDGRLEEGNSALFSFVLQHTAESDTGSIIDADMHELQPMPRWRLTTPVRRPVMDAPQSRFCRAF